MASGQLTIDLSAIAANWQALDALTACETGAVVKADGYGLGADRVARTLAHAGCRRFFVAMASEGAKVRQAVGPGPEIGVFSGHMRGDTDMIGDLMLTPMLNSLDQLTRHFEALPGHPFGIQLDTGMNRLGMEWDEWVAVAEIALQQRPILLMSHLACADEPDHPMNAYQLDLFRQMTDGLGVPRSLAATGGIQLGADYQFDLTRPGVGLYGGLPFDGAHPVVRLDLPVVQVRELGEGEVVGYGNSWQAARPSPDRHRRRRLRRRPAPRAAGRTAPVARPDALPGGGADLDGPDHSRHHRPARDPGDARGAGRAPARRRSRRRLRHDRLRGADLPRRPLRAALHGVSARPAPAPVRGRAAPAPAPAPDPGSQPVIHGRADGPICARA
ncbi:Alanine racemase [Wenxinia marina DSM 24838]|uniref:alanine racemase n=1 Tax=Wenxinia marina DSM 24838 TaxID=1123501 RepID=A0A0D0QCG4_9RHOB|nr:Alanine racemase [Wenxinia marina DSM 24838]